MKEGTVLLGQHHCRVLTDVTVRGHEAIILENRWLSVWVLPGKGGDIVQFSYKPCDLDATWGTVWGLGPPRPAAGFVDQYEGGWQEIFPNGGTESSYRGALLAQHEEAALLPWSWEVLAADRDRVAVKLTVDLLKTPFRLEKTLALTDEGPSLKISETATNLSDFPQRAMWGQHLAFGPPFLEPGCEIEARARTVVVEDEPTAPRLFRVGRYAWPYVDRVDGSRHDLRLVPSLAGARDIVYLTDFETGRYDLRHPVLGVRLTVRWDERVLPYCWYWQEYRADGYPWYGRHHNIGLEPFAGYPTHGLDEAIRNGSALEFGPGETRRLEWSVEMGEDR